MKIYTKYFIKRSFLISFFIFTIFAFLDLSFNFLSELENISPEYTFLHALKFVLLSMPHNAISFLEGACLLGVMISLGISHQEGNLNVLRSSGQSPLIIVLKSSIGSIILVISLLALDEISFREIHLNSEIEKNIKLNKQLKNVSDTQWIKDKDSYLSFSNIIDDTIYNVKFVKTNLEKTLYTKMSDSALISDDKVLFDKTLQIKNYNTSNQNLDIYEDFSFPLVVKIPFKNIENLSLFEISNYQKLIQESMIKDDLLFKLHLDKSFYKRLFYPFSILVLLIFFGSFIFASLRDSSPASRIVFAFVGGFLYKVIQDFSISFFISYGYSVAIGVILPSFIILIMSTYLYKKI